MNRTRILTTYRWVGGILVALLVLLGIDRANHGIQNLFDGRGIDRVEAGDEVGELSILSTRHLVVRLNSVLNILVGFSLMLGSVATYHIIEKHIIHRLYS